MKVTVKSLVGDTTVEQTADTSIPEFKDLITYGKTKIDPNPWKGKLDAGFNREELVDLFDKVGDIPWCYEMFTYRVNKDWFLGRIRGSIIKDQTLWLAEVIKIDRYNQTHRVLADGWLLFSFQAYQILEAFAKDKENVNYSDYFKRFVSGFNPHYFITLQPGQPYSLPNTELFYHDGDKEETYAFCRLNVPFVEDEKGADTNLVLLGSFQGEKGRYILNPIPNLKEIQRMGITKKRLIGVDKPTDHLFLFADHPSQIKPVNVKIDFDDKNVRYQFEWLCNDKVRGVAIVQDDQSLRVVVSDDARRKEWMLIDITIRNTNFFDVQRILKRILHGRYGCLAPMVPIFEKDLHLLYPIGDKILLASYPTKKGTEMKFYLALDEKGWFLQCDCEEKIKRSESSIFSYQIYQKLTKVLEKETERKITKTEEFDKFSPRLS